MRKWQIMVMVGLVLVMAVPLLAVAAEICPICNMDASKSETKFYVTIKGERAAFCSLRCAFLHAFVNKGASFQATNIGMDQLYDAKGQPLGKITTRDFQSGNFFNALEGYYISGGDVIPKGSMEPYSLGFSSLKRANSYWGKHKKPGMRAVNFETATHDVVDLLKSDGTIPKNWVYPGVSHVEAPKEQIEITIEEKGMIKEKK